jgi:hypothetical protein
MARKRQRRASTSSAEEDVVRSGSPDTSVEPRRRQMRVGPERSSPGKPYRGTRPARDQGKTTPGSGVIRRAVEAPISVPERRALVGINGRAVETNPYGEPILTKTVSVAQMPYGSVDWYCVSTGLGGAAYNPVQQWVQQLFPLLIQKVIQTGKFVQQSAGIESFHGWLNAYSNIFCTLRSLEGILAANGVNISCSQIADAGGQSIVRLEQQLQRLASYPVPQELVDMLDRLCGAFMYTKTGTVFWPNYDANTPADAILDMTNAANWTSMLNDVDSMFVVLTSATDSTVILNVLGTLFDVPIIGKKELSTNYAEVDAWVTQAALFNQTAAPIGFYGNPQIGTGAPGSPFTLLARCNRPVEPWELCLLRPPVGMLRSLVGNSNPEAAGITLGLVPPMTTVEWRAYTFDGGGAFIVNAGPIAGAAPALALARTNDLFTWQPWSSSGGTQVLELSGQMADWDRFTVTPDLMFDETILQMTRIFHVTN